MLMTDLNNKVTIIIRSVGERTEQLCRELILAQGVAPVVLQYRSR